MYLYSLTLNQATNINNSVYGSFSGANKHEIVVSKGKILEMMRLDQENGKMQVVYRQEVFGLIRSILPFRLLGMQKDFLVIGSDSGRIVILEYDNDHQKFVKIHQETFGKTGCRRIVPGEYLATDPKGRAIMIGAVEKQKFVYILNRDSQNKLTISSPLDAHKAHTITFAMVGVDVGIENPQFACLEADYGEADSNYSAVVTGQYQKMLTFYEMDLGLNHVVRKYSIPVDNSAHMLIQVPGEPYGPGGILLVCSNFLLYRKVEHEDRECPIPIRNDQVENKGLFFTAHTTFRTKNMFFFLIMSEYGDLYKVSLEYTNASVHGISVQYFDTTYPCTNINILRPGFLFAAGEFNNHILYQINDIGEQDPNPIRTYSTDKRDTITTFNPRELINLLPIDEFQNLASINDMKIDDLVGEGNPQLYLACGRGAYGKLRVLRHGLTVIEMAVTGMPQKPLKVMTIKGRIDDYFDKYMIISFQSSTLVLSIGTEKVSEVKDSGLADNERTLHVGALEDNSYVQVTPKSIIHIKGDVNNRKRAKWESGQGKIVKACSNTRQVAISLEGGQVVYFELDEMSGMLNEVESRFFDSEIQCLDIGEVPEGRQRCRFLAIGYVDKTVKIMSLDPESCLQRISMQALPALPESVALVNFKRDDQSQQLLFLQVGLVNGVLLRTVVDNVTGVLSDSRTKFLGTNAIQLAKIKQQGNNAIVALSNKPWLCYQYMNKVNITPLTYELLESASSFSSEKCPEGIVAIAGNTIRIISVERLGETFTHQVMNLRYTPTKMSIHPETNYLVILERDHNCFTYSERQELKKNIAKSTNDPKYLEMEDSKIGYPRAGENKFASCIRLVDPFQLQTLDLHEFENNEVVFSHFISTTIGKPGETYLILGTGLDVKFSPRSCQLGFIRTYKFIDNGTKLEFMHQTPCEDIPMSFNEYKGRLIAGVGNILRVYELGQKKLLRKVENKNFQSAIINIQVDEGRIYAGDISESVHVLKYKPDDIQLYIFADDVINRWLTSFCLLDQDTIAGVDKFENVFINRLPVGCEDDAEDDPTATKFKWENGYLNGAAFKMEEICQFFIGEVGTCIQKASLSAGSQECIIFGTASGAIGALLPFETREEIDFFVHLEMYLRIESQPLVGRDHVTFRSLYVPTKDVVDGDLCEQYSGLEFNKQRVLAEELDRTPPEVMKKLENLRNKIL